MMKRQFYKIAESLNAMITCYKTYRSDMGCQCYEITYTVDNKSFNFSDSYFPGEEGSKEKVLKTFTQDVVDKHTWTLH